MSSDLVVKTTPRKIGVITPVGLAAKAAKAAKAAALDASRTAPMAFGPVSEAKERIGIVFDDSGSMHDSGVSDAIAGVQEFLRNCKPNETAVAVYAMGNVDNRFDLTTNLPGLAMAVAKIKTHGCTPLLETLDTVLSMNITRAIVFSDGAPDSTAQFETITARCRERKICVDTVFIGTYGAGFMQKLAEETGGVYIKFEAGKNTFRTAFKYLAPTYRAMLADKSFVAKIESGSV